MKIQNIRFGHAVNSSSTHSIVIFPDGHNHFSNIDENNYGFQQFVLTDKADKLGYIGILLWEAVKKKNLPDYLWRYYVNTWLDGVHIDTENGYINAASKFPIPCDMKTQLPDLEFFADMRNHLLDEKIVIFGGSDQDTDSSWKHGDYYPDTKTGTLQRHSRQETPLEYVRKDPLYGYYTLYSPRSGHRLRFSFDGNAEMRCASSPELVDVSITDYCDKGCGFCYRGSDEEGEHASTLALSDIFKALAELKVFEIVLGGGQPTKHPKFADIVRVCAACGIRPAFTTSDFDWLADQENHKLVQEYCSKVAISITSKADIDCLEKVWAGYTGAEFNRKFVLQFIDGLVPLKELLEYLPGYKYGVSIVGYKPSRRQGDVSVTRFASPPFDVVSNIIRRNLGDCDSLRIDTTYVKDHIEEIKRSSISRELYETHEGAYSMFIDAVQMTMGPSSFCDEREMVKLERDNPIENYVHYADQIEKFFTSQSVRIALDEADQQASAKIIA
jgi:hypothetical protein